jgi:membrane-associated protease RseP (regulator of RpoE activity)
MHPLDPHLVDDMPPQSRMAAEAASVLRGRTHTHRILRTRVAFLLASTLVLDLVGSIVMYVLEHDKAQSGFHSFGGALFWVTLQLTTVSSSEPNPVTDGGQLIDVVLAVWGITVVATLAGALAAFFRARHVEDVIRYVREHELEHKPPPPG